MAVWVRGGRWAEGSRCQLTMQLRVYTQTGGCRVSYIHKYVQYRSMHLLMCSFALVAVDGAGRCNAASSTGPDLA